MIKLTKANGNGKIPEIGWGDCLKMGIMGNRVIGIGMLVATVESIFQALN